ncbi:mars [Drosophila busckii]|uniref:Mars n=1 Tax=Drosophila busckii TaxID=30019 RepID=A0A0M4EVI2_DROBS|nr:guanylate kinase-associated protein mars [Drosophila busckii]ALC41632.1 mars [Drosophila busckii]
MEYRKELYKRNSNGPRDHIAENRELQRLARAKNRENNFHSNRRFATPTPPIDAHEQLSPENATAQQDQENLQPSDIKAANVAENKPTRGELYLERFLEWKAQKRARQPPKNSPATSRVYHILSAKTCATIDLRSKTPALESVIAPLKSQVKPQITVPRKTRLSVKLPLKSAGKDTAANKPWEFTKKTLARRPLESAKKLTSQDATGTSVAAKKKVVSGNLNIEPLDQLATSSNLVKIVPKPKTIPKPVEIKQAAKTVMSASKPIMPAQKTAASTQKTSKQPALQNIMTQPFERPNSTKKITATAKPKTKNIIVKPIRGGGGAAAKFKMDKPKIIKSVTRVANQNLSQRMKPKKAGLKNQEASTQLLDLRRQLLQVVQSEPLLTPDTPLEMFNNENPFQAQATSTQCRSSNNSAHLQDVFGEILNISPVTIAPVESLRNSNVKRQLLPEPAASAPEKEVKRKFDFSRYSFVDSPELSNTIKEAETVEQTLMATEPTAIEAKVNEQTLVQQESTPPRKSEQTINYMSPYVSVSRGKVNSLAERVKRNSIYLQDQPETPVAERRTLESVRYFRLQLDKEIQRLHKLCDEWQDYDTKNPDLLQQTGGKDMIDAAVGQTRLLTSKKFMQFKSLIDRCEAGAKGQCQTDGSDATKPVLAEDLEGWWDMMRLQSENVDKRFSNLMRWKDNNWVDPDAVPSPKAKPKPKTMPKAKPNAKASSKLKSFLRKAYADKRQQQNNCPQSPNASRKFVVVVRDRKSFSPARTVLRMSKGNNDAARSSIEGGSPIGGGRPSIGGGRSSIGGGRPSIGGNSLLKSAIMGAAEKQRQQVQPVTPPPATVAAKRMSILKTPGTQRKREAGTHIVFSSKKNVRRFQFTFDESCGDESALGLPKLEDFVEDMTPERLSLENIQQAPDNDGTIVNPNDRMYTLRNRKVKLRQSSEFM